MEFPSTKAKIPVIIDTDPGVDDIIAILLALASPELEILAFVVTFGNTDSNASYLNILKLFQAIGRHIEQFPEDAQRFPNYSSTKKIILAQGCDKPVEGELHTAQYFHGRDGLGGITERHPDLNLAPVIPQEHPQLELSKQHGMDVALELLEVHQERSITYVVLGPMTTLAHITKKNPELVRKRIGRIISMGGALDVPGNTTPVAEFNYFADPFAVRELLVPGNGNEILPLDRFLLIPIDLTTSHELPFPFYTKMIDPSFSSASVTPSDGSKKSPLIHFTSSFLERTREIMISFGKDAMELHDIVAIWCAIENPPVPEDGNSPNLNDGWTALPRNFDIETNGKLTRGMLVVDHRNDQTAYAPGYNRAELQKQLEQLGLAHKPWESTAVPAQVEVEREPQSICASNDIWCVTKTPGPQTLLCSLLRKVWGVDIDPSSAL